MESCDSKQERDLEIEIHTSERERERVRRERRIIKSEQRRKIKKRCISSYIKTTVCIATLMINITVQVSEASIKS